MRQESKTASSEMSSVAQWFSSGNTDALTEILGDLQRRFGGRQTGRVLMLVSEGLTPASPPVNDWVIYRYPALRPSAGGQAGETGSIDTQDAMLPFADETFDTICLCSAVSLLVDRPEFPSEVYRVLKPKGVVVVIEPVANFNFAPLPAGGPAQLVRRHLTDVGLRHVHPLASPRGLLAFAAATDADT